MTMATIDASIVIIAMPAIFRGIGLNPLTPGNVTYLLWMIIGYLLVQSVLVVTLGRLGDMFGRDPSDAPFRCPESRVRRTLTQSTAEHLLNGNYLSW